MMETGGIRYGFTNGKICCYLGNFLRGEKCEQTFLSVDQVH